MGRNRPSPQRETQPRGRGRDIPGAGDGSIPGAGSPTRTFPSRQGPSPLHLTPGKASLGGAASPAWLCGGDQGLLLVPGVLGPTQAASPAGIIYPTAGSSRQHPAPSFIYCTWFTAGKQGLGDGDHRWGWHPTLGAAGGRDPADGSPWLGHSGWGSARSPRCPHAVLSSPLPWEGALLCVGRFACSLPPSPYIELRSRLRDRSVEAMGMSPGRPRPRIPWLLVPLLMVAGAVAAQPWQVNGVLGGSVLLSPVPSPNKTVTEVEWSFTTSTGARIRVAEFGPGGFKRPDPKDRFKDRLEIFSKTVLRIRALERGDSGVYGARIKLQPALVEDQSFNLSVYGPVPAPEIHNELLSLTAQGCNVTLRCRVPAGSDAVAAWQLGGSLGTPHGQLSEDNQTLRLAVPASAFNSSYTCVAQNPIQEQNVSVHLGTLCQQQERHGWERWHLCLVLLAAGVAALLSIVWLQRKKRRKKEAEGAALASPSSEDAPLEPPYAVIERRAPPEADEWQRDHPTTIYSQVQAGAGSWTNALA
ncbi:uncharacterized protein LJ206_020821 [Theristicus caerulescens]